MKMTVSFRLVIIQLLQEILKELMTNTTTEKIQTMEEDIVHTVCSNMIVLKVFSYKNLKIEFRGSMFDLNSTQHLFLILKKKLVDLVTETIQRSCNIKQMVCHHVFC